MTTREPDVPMLGIRIERPVGEVFDYVMDIERTPTWRPRMSEVHWIGTSEPDVGSRFEVVVKTLGLRVRFQPEIVHWDPPTAVTYRQSTGPAQMDSYMEWIADGDHCWFMMGARAGTKGWMRFLAPVIGRSILRQNMSDLIRLKNQMERRV